MLKATVAALRSKFQNTGIQIFSDNVVLYNSKSQYTTLVWDDTNEILYAFRPNNSHYNQDKKRMTIDATEYANIEYMTTQVSRDEMVTLLNQLKTEGTLDDATITEILTSYDNLDNKLL